jgi:ribosomal-protein-alanine N-acetyltransferase
MTALLTERLALDPVTERNALALWRVMQNAHLREFQDVPRFTRDEFTRRVKARPRGFDGKTPGRFEWLIVERESGTPIGWMSLRITEQTNASAELGYSLLLPARRKGYATEAGRAVVELAFETGLTTVEACCVPQNVASRRVLENIGFSQVRLQRSGAVVRGRPVDVCVYRLARRERAVERVMDRRQTQS